MKRLLAVALMAFAPVALAGQFDGVYQCRVSIPALSRSVDLLTVFISHDDGNAGFSALCPTPETCQGSGYALGYMNGSEFIGRAGDGTAISFTFLANQEFNYSDSSTYNGIDYPSSTRCIKFW